MAIWVQRIGTYNIILQVCAVVKFQKRQFVIILYRDASYYYNILFIRTCDEKCIARYGYNEVYGMTGRSKNIYNTRFAHCICT